MNKKLTLTLEKATVEEAESYAAAEGRSLSELVGNYLRSLKKPIEEAEADLLPRVKKLRRVLNVGQDFNYKKVLEEELLKKYRCQITDTNASFKAKIHPAEDF